MSQGVSGREKSIFSCVMLGVSCRSFSCLSGNIGSIRGYKSLLTIRGRRLTIRGINGGINVQNQIHSRHTSRYFQHFRQFRHFSSNLNTHTPKIHNSHCVNLVKNKDYPSYLTGLLLPSSVKASYFAINAFNIETSVIKEALRGGVNANKTPAKMRMGWWREAIEEAYEGNVNDQKMQQPVVAAMVGAIEEVRATSEG